MLAPLLPAGFRASAWPDFTPIARQLFLAQFLAVNDGLVLTGTVDYESAREPVLLYDASGKFVSLAGQVVDTGAGLTVNVTEGALIGGRGLVVLLIVAVAAVVLLR